VAKKIKTMNLNYKKYDNYKPSGVEWLGDVPEHWEILANKHIFKLKKNLVGRKSSEYDLLSLTLNGIIKRDMENPQGKFPAEFDTYQEVKKDNFVFCLFDVEETPRTVGLSDFDGMITGAYTVMETNPKFNSTFLYYFYLNLDKDKRLRPLYRGLRNTIPKDSFFSFKTFVPTLTEQTAIANFLDRKTAQIDQAIAQKEQLIELLKERRQILIHEAVTQGLDKSVEMKDSGVEWIGDVPKHWGVSKAKLYSEVFVPERSKPILNTTKDGLPWITTHLLRKEKIKLSDVKYFVSYKAQRQAGSRKINAENIIATCVGTFGLSTKITFDCIINQQLQGYQKLRINANYLNLIIKISEDYFKNNATLTTIMYVNKDTFGNLPITIPPIKEQIEIANYIETQSQKIKTAISLKQQEIAALKEYKIVLIDAAVTGKIVVD
jgi:type I restriction enzyme S subunit